MPQTPDHHSELVTAGALLYAFDAASPPPANVYKANGGIAANVYVSGNYAQNAAHVNSLRAAGIGPWPNYERGLWELLNSTDDHAAGVQAARVGIADAVRCGFPADGTIWFPFSVDVAVPSTRYGEVANAFRGIQEVNAGRYRISFYGQGDLARYLRAQGVIHERCWLSASSSFPGWNPNSIDICVWQQVGNFIPGHSTDRNVITAPYALGAWWPAGSPYAQGADMPLTPADVSEVANAVWAKTFTAVGADNKPSSPAHSAAVWLANTNMDVRNVPTVATLYAALNAHVGGDPQVIAQAVAQALGPDIAKQVATELGAIITKGATA